jgi:hypothetical protein
MRESHAVIRDALWAYILVRATLLVSLVTSGALLRINGRLMRELRDCRSAKRTAR